MTELLHVSDSYAAADAGENRTDATGGLDLAVGRTLEVGVDAVVHTGNLFRRPAPSEDDLAVVGEELDRLAEAGVPFLAVAGYREAMDGGGALASLSTHPAVERLSHEPRVVGDVALYGVDHTDDVAAAVSELEPDDGFRYNVVCMHQRIWPPAWEEGADISAYDVADATEVHVSAILAGGFDDPRSWQAEDGDYRVSYPGSTNRNARSAGEPVRGSVLTVTGYDAAEREPLDLETSSLASEIDHVATALEYDRAALDGADTGELADLYGLLARAKKVFDDRRKAVRDELLDRVDDDRELDGSRATVRRQTRRRRRVRDDEAVFAALREAGVDREEVLSLDGTELRALVDEGVLDEREVFDITESATIRLEDVDL